MANGVRGETELEVEGERYLLVLDFNALCSLEDHLDLSVADITQRLRGNIRGSFLRSVLWGALQRHHEGVSEAEAGNIIQAAGVSEVLLKIWEAVNRAFPAKAEGDANAPEDPPKPKRRRAGTGTTS